MNDAHDGANASSRRFHLSMLMVAMSLGGCTAVKANQFDSLVNPTDFRMIKLAQKVVLARDTTVVALWPDPVSTRCKNLAVIRRHPLGVQFVPVDIARLSDDAPFVLISGDRRTMFELTSAGEVTASACAPSRRIERAIEQGTAQFEDGYTGYHEAA
ncbi:hypothetical protein Q9K01_05880 [Qipengyuania sp. DY56-A-20]|jgi:hypothetical protein|uniref:Lipoprotein n=1 Tax=Qipengyuania benthica TaxID=3067651 RepID=A0ABT9H751_9SPHN|nr:hypothetical protein [Qipengyuania sp. DY56-A-20]MDP4539148.1 hypothetical protein [Qipengyuania sp. DY56-A-20]